LAARVEPLVVSRVAAAVKEVARVVETRVEARLVEARVEMRVMVR